MRSFFYGWYFKCQSDIQTLAVIPAIHTAGGKQTCSIQIITGDGTWTATFPGNAFCRAGKQIAIGNNRFGERGIRLSLHTPELDAEGCLDFGPLFPLRYDIMGPFALVPFLECRHSVWSVQHAVYGKMRIGQHEYTFRNARGYWEGDSGRSFPREYAWTQCSFSGGSLMLSVADIPMMGFHFTGVIGFVLWKGKEYRIATYLGARAVRIRDGKICIVQGNLELEVCLLEAAGKPLRAPTNGDMVRTIHESAACRAGYRLCRGNQVLFSFQTDKASFEYEYPC